MSKLKTLLELDFSSKIEKRNGYNYVSWAYAWGEFLKVYPDATYSVQKNTDGTPLFGNKSLGYIVYTSVTAASVTREMWLNVMDSANKDKKDNMYNYEGWKWSNGSRFKIEKSVEAITMFDVNKSVMRCLVKNLAMFGAGLYIYKGEDLPEVIDELEDNPTNDNAEQLEVTIRKCSKCKTEITEDQARLSLDQNNTLLCQNCMIDHTKTIQVILESNGLGKYFMGCLTWFKDEKTPNNISFFDYAVENGKWESFVCRYLRSEIEKKDAEIAEKLSKNAKLSDLVEAIKII